MEFDWTDASFDLKALPPKEIEESFEDPFALRLLPDDDAPQHAARYFNLGYSLSGIPVFSVFWTDGKRYRVIVARAMNDEESRFLQRKVAENI